MKRSAIKWIIVSSIWVSLTACTLPSSTPTASPAALTPTATTTPSATPIPLTHLKIGIESTQISANVISFLLDDQPTYGDSLFQSFLHPGLFRMDPVSGKSVQWIANDDELVWVNSGSNWTTKVSLDRSVQWNNGKPLTADDIVFSKKAIQSLTQTQSGSIKTALDELEISTEPDGSILLSVKVDPSMLPALNSAVRFPVLNREYWAPRLEALINSVEFHTLNAVSNDLLLLSGEKQAIESRQNILLQQISDTNIMLSGTKATLDYMKNYVDNKGWVNLNGVKDSEVASGYTQQIPGFTHLVVQMQTIYDDQVAQLAVIQNELADLNGRMDTLRQQQQQAVSALAAKYKVADQSTEPLLIPYRVSAENSPGNILLEALVHDEHKPDRITFAAADRSELLTQFSNAQMGFIFTRTPVSDPTVQFNPTRLPVLTGLIFNPVSEPLLFPGIRTAISCIYTANEIWADEPVAGELMLSTPGRLPVPDGSLETCTGDLSSRLSFLVGYLESSGFRWRTNPDGSIVAGSLLDPAGKNISSISINVPPSSNLPAVVEEKFTRSLQSIGIQVQFLRENITVGDPLFQQPRVDILISQWVFSPNELPGECGIIPSFERSGFSAFLITSLRNSCQVRIQQLLTTPGPSPTPPVMVSGKIPKPDDLVENTWYSLLYSNYSEYMVQENLDSVYDLAWLKSLTPSWPSGWTR